MEQVTLSPATSNDHQSKHFQLVGSEIELIDIFRFLSDEDQERVIRVVKGMAWAVGPISTARRPRNGNE